MKLHIPAGPALLGGAFLVAAVSGCAPVPVAETPARNYDEVAARSLAHKDSCLRCHGVNRQKRGPAYHEIAGKYRGNPGAEERIYVQLTTGEGPVMPDGHHEEHRMSHSQKPEEIRNLVRWVLDQ